MHVFGAIKASKKAELARKTLRQIWDTRLHRSLHDRGARLQIFNFPYQIVIMELLSRRMEYAATRRGVRVANGVGPENR